MIVVEVILIVARCRKILFKFLNDIWSTKFTKKILHDHRNLEVNISNAVFSTVSADGLAAKAAAVTVIIKIRFHIYTWPELEGLQLFTDNWHDDWFHVRYARWEQ